VIDDYGRDLTEAEFAALPEHEETDDWAAVDDDELDGDNVAHLDPEGLRYYLPAFMLRLLDSGVDQSSMWAIGTIAALDQRGRHPRGFLELLTPQQSRAIALYVRALPELVDLDYEDTTRLARAFEDVWSRFLGEGPSQCRHRVVTQRLYGGPALDDKRR
jgi:hypothetical protein